MTSKRAIETIRAAIGIDDERFDIIEKDLIILMILKSIIEIEENTKYTAGPRYYIKLRQDVFITDETKKMLKEWLDER